MVCPMTKSIRKSISGIGIGLRSSFFNDILKSKEPIPWIEIQSEDYFNARGHNHDVLDSLRGRFPLVMHGVNMSIASTDELNYSHLNRLRELINILKPQWVSDHLCWSSLNGIYLHNLLPIPYYEESLKHVVNRIKKIQDFLGQSILIENVSSYLAFQESTIQEWDFLQQVAEEANCYILLDINNIYVSAFNLKFNPEHYLNGIDGSRVRQFHLAGFTDFGNYLLDSHCGNIHPSVLTLYEKAIQMFGAKPTSIEWDTAIPNFNEICSIRKKVADIVKRNMEINVIV